MKKLIKLLFIILIFHSQLTFSQSKSLTIRQVFNFDIGDKFQRKTDTDSGISYDRITIVDKQVSVNNDSITYRIARNNYSIYMTEFGTQTYAYKDTISKTYTNLDESILNYLPEFTINYLEENYADYSYQELNGVNYGTTVSGFEVFVYYFSGGQNYNKYLFGNGIGKAYYMDASDPEYCGGVRITELYYYKKGNTTYGIPNNYTPPSSSVINETNNKLNIFPNPAENYIFLEIPKNKSCSYTIYNIAGIVVKKGKIESNEKIDIQSLNSGLYVIHACIDGDKFISKLQVKKLLHPIH